MTTVRREPLADQAAELLLDRVRAGEWALGAKLPGETTLAPQLGVGRSTVREAIRQLAGRGVLATRQGAGVFVIALDAAEEWSHVVGRADIRAVLEARRAIEVEAARSAAARRTPADLRALRTALERRAAHRDVIDEHVDTDAAFHRAIVVASHNPLLLDLFDGFTPRSREAMIAMLRLRGGRGSAGSGVSGSEGREDVDQDVHRLIAEAIADRDEDAAASRTHEHLTSLIDQLAR